MIDLEIRLGRCFEKHRNRHDLPRGELLEIIKELVELLSEVLEHGHDPHHRRSVIVQVLLNDTQKVLLHAVEENAEGQPIDRDAASAVWSQDRDDIVTSAPSADGFDNEVTTVGGGVVGDTVITVTVSEPDSTDDAGNAVTGAQYVGTQVVTVSLDETIAAVEITADAPEAK